MKFNYEAQEWFAAVSGDYNPMHMDADWARRSLLGSPIVHGIHSVIYCFDKFPLPDTEALKSLQVRFIDAIELEQSFEIRHEAEPSSQKYEWFIDIGDKVAVHIKGSTTNVDSSESKCLTIIPLTERKSTFR